MLGGDGGRRQTDGSRVRSVVTPYTLKNPPKEEGGGGEEKEESRREKATNNLFEGSASPEIGEGSSRRYEPVVEGNKVMVWGRGGGWGGREGCGSLRRVFGQDERTDE